MSTTQSSFQLGNGGGTDSDLLAAFDNPLEHLTVFPYFNNYILLSQLEHGLLARHVPGPPPSRVAFVGSGPLPLSSLVLAARHLPAASFEYYDICGDANDRARRLVRGDGALQARMADVTREMASYDVVFLAALVGMAAEEKARVVEHLGRHMAPGAALVVRSAHGARGFLYPVVDPEEIRRGGFDVLAVHHPEGEVINSVIIARKPVAVDAQNAPVSPRRPALPHCAAPFAMSTTQSSFQLGNGGGTDSIINMMDPIQVTDEVVDEAAAGSDNSEQLRRWLYSSGFATLVMAAATAFYRPPRGAIFEQHRFAYYATLAGIFAVGVAQVGTACWLSSSSQQSQRRSRAFRVVAISGSVVLLAATVALGGFSVIMKGG